MPNTYTQIFIHAVFAVQNRNMLIKSEWEIELHRYMAGVVRNNGHKMISINGMSDHIHVLIGMKPAQSLSELIQDIKGNSSNWINQRKFLPGKFRWQEGFGAFSYSTSQVKSVATYIENQKIHHGTISFIDEYLEILKKFNVEFDPRYIFRAPA